MKNILVMGGVVALLLFGSAVYNSQKQNNPNNVEVVVTPIVTPTEVTSPTEVVTQSEVPLPQETDIIRTFINLIDEGKASDAVMMMKEGTAYRAQFNAINSVKVSKLEESSKADWSETWHQYMATLDIQMDPSSASGPVPYYGYDSGENIRFINLIKEGGKWAIEGLATGP